MEYESIEIFLEKSLASDVKDMTLEEFSNKYLVCVNATYSN